MADRSSGSRSMRLVQTRGGGELLRFGDFVATGPVLEVVVTPWWQEMVEGRRKWSWWLARWPRYVGTQCGKAKIAFAVFPR